MVSAAATQTSSAKKSAKRSSASVPANPRTADRHLNIAHVINPAGAIVYEYAKVHMAGRDERKYCRGGNKLAFFEIDGVPCTLVICRDGRHPAQARRRIGLAAAV